MKLSKAFVMETREKRKWWQNIYEWRENLILNYIQFALELVWYDLWGWWWRWRWWLSFKFLYQNNQVKTKNFLINIARLHVSSIWSKKDFFKFVNESEFEYEFEKKRKEWKGEEWRKQSELKMLHCFTYTYKMLQMQIWCSTCR